MKIFISDWWIKSSTISVLSCTFWYSVFIHWMKPWVVFIHNTAINQSVQTLKFVFPCNASAKILDKAIISIWDCNSACYHVFTVSSPYLIILNLINLFYVSIQFLKWSLSNSHAPWFFWNDIGVLTSMKFVVWNAIRNNFNFLCSRTYSWYMHTSGILVFI